MEERRKKIQKQRSARDTPHQRVVIVDDCMKETVVEKKKEEA